MASGSAGSVKKPGSPDWDKRVEDVKISKTDLNLLVMNYLIIEGYESAAHKFAQEANLKPQFSFYEIEERVQIRNAIHSGNIEFAIQRINELYPEILDTNPSLHFSLLRLQLIELIRTCTTSPDGDIGEALAFATTHLAPRAARAALDNNTGFLHDLERTMALLCFPSDNLAPPLAALMDPLLRRDVASKVNQVILDRDNSMKEAKIRGLVRLRGWAEQRLRSDKRDIPALGLGLDIAGAGVSSAL